MPNPELLDEQIDRERNNIRTDRLDMTYGELSSMYENEELIVAPEYQRLFRWSDYQKAKFIESILLGFPIPAIFVAETDKGVWELVDGLQRMSTVLEFMGVLRNAEGKAVQASRLNIPDAKTRLSELHGLTFDELSLRSRLSIKRASCRVEVIKVGSAPKMKYEVFERLNTGASGLTPQEVRNCIFRATNPQFMEWVDELARYRPFIEYLGLSDAQSMSMYDRGLVLRFLTLKNNYHNFRHDVDPFVTAYMRSVVEGEVPFNMEVEERVFKYTFDRITEVLGEDSWRHYRDGQHLGAFSVYVFDALTVAVSRNIETVRGLSDEQLRTRLMSVKQAREFVANVGAGGNARSKMLARLDIAVRLVRGV